MKICSLCKIEKEDIQFCSRGIKRTGLSAYCKSCLSISDRSLNKKIKIEAFEKYGGVCCACCGITELSFLSLDHEDNSGSVHRKQMGTSGTRLYRWLKRYNWPNLNLRVLCFNCNLGRQINKGVCPHQISIARWCN